MVTNEEKAQIANEICKLAVKACDSSFEAIGLLEAAKQSILMDCINPEQFINMLKENAKKKDL